MAVFGSHFYTNFIEKLDHLRQIIKQILQNITIE